ncbi:MULTISPECIES: sensor histidine kinase [unclassified Ectothiorhodospira]|uniref:sensor histidine kinase n=1 Tax=unclassified Ectothiorhodospira TaxID=2684909 RepID=UPI001EE914B9|nr:MULTISPECIES: sensor histidine kinase [unclassified Ectothiorhodospira]MCG5516890.1 sensor histidine kinase [Ectothiorhodospira sp. 9100]MCG5519852.1 sensor histidine kinase [Ectothiorhodospira sp. 9905]
MNSLKFRLSLLAGSCLLALLIAQGLGLQALSRVLVDGYLVDRLDHDADTLYVHLLDSEEGPAAFNRTLGIIYSTPLSGHYFRIESPGSVVRSRSLWDEDLESPDVPEGEQWITRIQGPGDQPLLMLSRGYRIEDEAVVISVAQELGPMKAAVDELEGRFMAITLPALGLALLLQFLVIHRALRPLDAAVDACRRLETGEAVPVELPAPREIAPMLKAVNRLVHHHGLRLNRSRRALGNVSHALKTPLAVLSQLADDMSVQGDDNAARTLRQQLHAMNETVEREMRRASLAGRDHPGPGFNARKELTGLVEALHRIHQHRVTVHLQVPAGTWPLDADDMLEIFGNLLDNACRWAASQVRVELRVAHGHTLKVIIEDDGPGIPPEGMPLLGRQGRPLDERGDGHGLGLGIVQDVVDQYEGQITYDASPDLGGLRVTLSLPLPHPASLHSNSSSSKPPSGAL